MFERAERLTPRPLVLDEPGPHLDRSEAPPSLLDRVHGARKLAARWRDRIAPATGAVPRADASSIGADRTWLSQVPDVGPACEVVIADRLFHDLSLAERDGLLAWIRGNQDESGAWLDTQGRPDLSLTTLGWWACAVA